VTATAPLLGSTTETDVHLPEHMTVSLDFVLGTDRTFANTSLGVRVSGDFSGDGSMGIGAGREPPVSPPGGFKRIFEITDHGFTCMTKIHIVVWGQPFKDVLAGKDLSKYKFKLYTHPGGSWGAVDKWDEIPDSGYDSAGGFFWANVSHLSVFGIGFSARTTGPTGTTIVALPPWLSPVAVVAIVVLVGVPIGIIIIRMRQPPSGGGKQGAPVPPPPQSGANLYP
jgi:hypothetical protein